MSDTPENEASAADNSALHAPPSEPDSICPICGAKLISEKCKVVCRSERCRYRIIFNCAEF